MEPADVSVAHWRGARILVADEHAVSRLWATRLLDGLNCRWAEAVDGPMALDLLAQAANDGDPFRVALVDASLPGMNGTGWSRKIQNNPALADLRLVLVSPLGRPGANAFEQLGFAAPLTKPLRQSRLRHCLAGLIGPESGRVEDIEASPDSCAMRPPSNAAGLRILVVEDNTTNQLVAVAMVSKFGCQADAVANGQEALEVLRRVPYGLVLMDCQMPEMDGFEAARRIRSGTSGVLNPAVPIVALTASALDSDRTKCLHAGMDDYLRKPIDPAELAQALDRWSHQSSNAPVSCRVSLPETGSAPASAVSAPNKLNGSPAAVVSLIFDRAGLLQRLMGDTQLAEAVAGNFLAEMPGRVVELLQAVGRREAGQARTLAHQIKGASATVGGTTLFRIAGDMEQAGEAGDLPRREALAPQLETHFAALKKSLAGEAWSQAGKNAPTKTYQ